MKKGLHISGMSMASSAAAGITIKGRIMSWSSVLLLPFVLAPAFPGMAWPPFFTPSWAPCSKAGAVHPVIHRLLKPLTPDDCPACRLASTPSSSAGPAPAPVRPWCEVKSRQGAPKRIPTEGYACPNQQCVYFGITDAHIHALVGDGKHGQTERIQTFRCQACRNTFTARRHTPMYRLKTPSQQVAIV